MRKKRLIVGISGGSGIPIAIELLRLTKQITNLEVHLIYTRGAEMTLAEEADITVEELKMFADRVYDIAIFQPVLPAGHFVLWG